jgi:hypothetical protein
VEIRRSYILGKTPRSSLCDHLSTSVISPRLYNPWKEYSSSHKQIVLCISRPGVIRRPVSCGPRRIPAWRYKFHISHHGHTTGASSMCYYACRLCCKQFSSSTYSGKRLERYWECMGRLGIIDSGRISSSQFIQDNPYMEDREPASLNHVIRD